MAGRPVGVALRLVNNSAAWGHFLGGSKQPLSFYPTDPSSGPSPFHNAAALLNLASSWRLLAGGADKQQTATYLPCDSIVSGPLTSPTRRYFIDTAGWSYICI